jgi:hypothetical protein
MASTGQNRKQALSLDDMQAPGDQAPVTLYLHCQKAYQRMFDQAKLQVMEDGSEAVMWEGMLTHLIVSELNLSVPYYTRVTRALKAMGCIRQVRRGGGSSPSQWELLQEPTEAAFMSFHEGEATDTTPTKKGSTRIDMALEQVAGLNRRLQLVEKALEAFIKGVDDA